MVTASSRIAGRRPRSIAGQRDGRAAARDPGRPRQSRRRVVVEDLDLVRLARDLADALDIGPGEVDLDAARPLEAQRPVVDPRMSAQGVDDPLVHRPMPACSRVRTCGPPAPFGTSSFQPLPQVPGVISKSLATIETSASTSGHVAGHGDRRVEDAGRLAALVLAGEVGPDLDPPALGILHPVEGAADQQAVVEAREQLLAACSSPRAKKVFDMRA